jgi:hypothetical protein
MFDESTHSALSMDESARSTACLTGRGPGSSGSSSSSSSSKGLPLYIATKPMFIYSVLTPFCQVGKRSLRKDLSWLLSRLSSAYSSGISESYGCSESLLGKKMV